MSGFNHTDLCDERYDDCFVECRCGRGDYPSCRYTSCYDCFLDRRADYHSCILCARWHRPEYDTCFKCRPDSRGRDDAAQALRQLILHRDGYACRTCGAIEGDEQYDPRAIGGIRYATIQVDHIVPCAAGGRADEWNLQTLCGLHNAAKGATWFVGCQHEDTRTQLMRRYFWIAPGYFSPEALALFRADVDAWRGTGTWDPAVHADWRSPA